TIFELLTLKKKSALNIIFLVIGVIFIFVLFGGACLNDGHPINFKGVIFYVATFPLVFGYYTWKNKKKKTSTNKSYM
ncbi:MAG: hypothetical protein D6707_06935, partial [Bacteroidetes bacterium]